MGAVLGVCTVANLACCCGSAACSLCCSACPPCKNSTSTRIMYAAMLLLTTITCCIMLSPGVVEELKTVPFCSGSECSKVVGYLAVYRICFAVTLFFLAMAGMMVQVYSSKDPRAGIQNGFWGLKWLILIGLAVGAFFIPETAVGFGQVWMYFGMLGGFGFILIQLILIVDFAHRWAELWVSQYEETGARVWCVGLCFFTGLNYTLAIMAYILFWIYYAQPEQCYLNQVFIILNVSLSVVMSVTSVLPQVQERLQTSGLLQASTVTMYCVYLTWSAMSNNPNHACKPSFSNSSSLDTQSIFGIVLWIFCVLSSSIRNSTSNSTKRLSLGIKVPAPVCPTTDEECGTQGQDEAARVHDNECEAVAYNWSFFHLMFAMATLYIMMTLTGWFTPSQNLKEWTSNLSAVWIKIVSSWVCAGLYIWTLVAPIVFKDREF